MFPFHGNDAMTNLEELVITSLNPLNESSRPYWETLPNRQLRNQSWHQPVRKRPTGQEASSMREPQAADS